MAPDADGAQAPAFYEVELHPRGAIVRRTRRPYLDLEELADSFAALELHFQRLPAEATTLLVDLRLAGGRNDEAFEAALAPLRRALLSRFPRTGLLVRSTIGRLQLERYLAADGIQARVFADEAAAMDWFLDAP